MKNLLIIDELRAIRKRLAQEQAFDVEKYAAMLREAGRSLPGEYVTQPVLPPAQSRCAPKAPPLHTYEEA